MISPREFGLIGMTAIFMAVSQIFINSGFSTALIRKAKTTQVDYSTVFYFNLGMGFLFYAILFISAGPIGIFFNEPLLKPIIRLLGLDIIIRSFTIIQTTVLTKRIDFKLQTKISIIAALLSGIVGIAMAQNGFGVWSLVFKVLTGSLLISLLLWWWNRWRPSLIFSMASFRELFGFGSKLLASGLIDTIYNNIYYLVIGKYFAASELGYFSRAKMFSDPPSQQITNIVSRVAFPVLSQIQDNTDTLKAGFRRMITISTFTSFVLLAWLAAVAEPLVVTLIGETWRPSIIYLQMLCFPGMLYPLQALNLSILQMRGRSDLFLRLEIIKKILAAPVIIIGIMWGIKVMIAGIMVLSVISWYLNSYWSGKMINYPLRNQIVDVMPSFLLALIISLIVFLTGKILPYSYPVKLLIQLFEGGFLLITISELLNFSSYLYLKEIIISKLTAYKNAR